MASAASVSSLPAEVLDDALFGASILAHALLSEHRCNRVTVDSKTNEHAGLAPERWAAFDQRIIASMPALFSTTEFSRPEATPSKSMVYAA